MMVTAFDVLFRYTVNMLKLKRPRNWHTIKFSNAQFKARADCMIGTRNILKLMGYTNPIVAEDGSQSGLSYPDPTQINHDGIKIIGAELLTAKFEVKTAQEQRGFSYPLPMENVQLDNPHANQPMRHPQFEPDYYSSIPQHSTHFQPSPTARPIASSEMYSNYDSMSYSSQYGNPQTLTQHGSYQPPSSSYQPPSSNYQPPSGGYQSSSSGYQSSSSSYGQPNVQPHNQQFDYQHRDQFGYQPNYQSSNQSSESTTYFETPTSSLSSSQPSSTEQQQPNTGGVSGRLAAIRKRKEEIKQSLGDAYPFTSMPTTAPALFAHPSSTIQPSNVSPSTTAEIQPSNPPPPTAASTQPAKPPPRKPRTKFLAVAPSNDEVKYPPSLPEETAPSIIHEEPPPPVQQPQVRKATLPRSRGPREMVECDHCGFPNHEKSQQCMECENPRTERWRKIQIPSSGSSTGEQGVVPTVADVNNQPPPQEREAYNPRHETVAPPNIQRTNSQPSSVGSGHLETSSGAAGASGTSAQPLRAYIPVVNYTAEEKEEMRKKAEMERMMALQQEQDMHGGGAETAPLNSYVPRNDNYNWDKGMRPTGNVFNTPNSTEPEDPQMYKSLGTQGHILIQDVKVHVYSVMAVYSVLVLWSVVCASNLWCVL